VRRVRKALVNLPWVDPDKIEINYQRQVRLTITDMSKFDAAQLTGTLMKTFPYAKVVRIGKEPAGGTRLEK
jgi:hypothetical protein